MKYRSSHPTLIETTVVSDNNNNNNNTATIKLMLPAGVSEVCSVSDQLVAETSS